MGWLALSLVALTAGAAAQQIDFQKEVLPILERSCLDCHQGPRTDAEGRRKTPKGGLRLDGRHWILLGGDKGRALTPGDASKSPLYTRTVLPEDHEDLMPADGDLLTAAQISTLKTWIDQGAGFGTWVGAPALPGAGVDTPGGEADVGAAWTRRFPAELAKGLAPVPVDVLANLAGGKVRITPLTDGSPLLRVEFPGMEDQVTDTDIAALAGLKDHVVQIHLARTRITDRALSTLAQMPRLCHLDLRETKVTEKGVAYLVAAKELRVLNLFSTRVGDGAIPALSRLQRLESLHLWQSEVTPEGLRTLRERLPAANITGAPDLPVPTQGPQNPRRRR